MNTAAPPPLPQKTQPLKEVAMKASIKKMPNFEELEPKQYVLEDTVIPVDDSDEDLEFEEVPIELFQEESDDDAEESLEQAVRNMHEKGYFGATDKAQKALTTMKLTKHPEVIDDYIRNFLATKGLSKSLEAFQNEWYENQINGTISKEDLIPVPEVYQQNQQLSDNITKLREDVLVYKDIAEKARATYDKLRKERDFHRMHHKRVVQEKGKLIMDIKKIKKHYENYEPTLKQLQLKYEVSMKEKMLIKLERDRLATKLLNLEQNIKTMEKIRDRPASGNHKQKDVSRFPIEDRVNPFSAVDLREAKPEKMRQIHHIQGHNLAISCIKFHPKKPILATVSDDKTWKLWSFPNGELVMSGKGHQDWIADCDFHPLGSQLATASGDGTIKLWDFSKGIATTSFTDHSQAVWSCAFHDMGSYLISGSMDHTVKLWDLVVGKCRQTFRGHAESVNHVGFQPYSNMLFSCSGDKTISFWDGRTGLCVSTLFGHNSAINHANFSVKGNYFASCDSEGVVKLWDIRQTHESLHIDIGGRQAVNKLAFDPSGTVLSAACNAGSVKFINVLEGSIKSEIKINDESCQAVLFDRSAEYFVASGNDGTYRIFQ